MDTHTVPTHVEESTVYKGTHLILQHCGKGTILIPIVYMVCVCVSVSDIPGILEILQKLK